GLRREVRRRLNLRGPAAQRPDAQRHQHPLRHPPPRRRGHRRRERRYGGRGGRRPLARRPGGSGRQGAPGGDPDAFRWRCGGDRGRLHRYLRGPEARVAATQGGLRGPRCYGPSLGAARLRGGQAAQRPLHPRGPARSGRRAVEPIHRRQGGDAVVLPRPHRSLRQSRPESNRRRAGPGGAGDRSTRGTHPQDRTRRHGGTRI
ncbi:MAG: GTP pyrophosphokinase, partial [uncultured Rubrobacteraceae bacterium]